VIEEGGGGDEGPVLVWFGGVKARRRDESGYGGAAGEGRVAHGRRRVEG